MHRFNSYHGQTVLESELDAMFDDCENAEHDLATDLQHAQADFSASPDATVYGGILGGLVITGTPGDDHVHVSAGVARDEQGRRINFPTAGTVKITNVGSSPVGDPTDALCAGASITSIGAGNYVVASLWIAYGELLTNPKTDLLGATVYYDIAESFSFEIQIVGAYANPPAAPPARAPLADGKVLLADIILLNSAGNIIVSALVPAVCVKDEDWDTLGGNYISLAGRRSDWLALDQGADFPQHNAKSVEVRTGSARAALYDIVKKLQVQAANPAGASLVGARAQTGTAGYGGGRRADLPVGSIDTQLLYLLNEINKKIGRVGAMPQPFYEDFCYVAKGAGHIWTPETESPYWSSQTVGGPGTLALSVSGSCVDITSGGGAGDAIAILLGYKTGTARYFYRAGQTGIQIAVDFLLGDLTDTVMSFGLTDGTATAHCTVDTAAGTTVATVVNSAGGGADTSASVWVPVLGRTTLVLETTPTNVASIRLGQDGVSENAECTVGDFGISEFFFILRVGSKTGLHAGAASIDAICIGETSARP